MAIGRISGPMLKPNLERQGVDLAFETDLLYLDVTNGRIGIKNSAPTVALDVTGSGKLSNNLTVLGLTNLGNLRLSNNTLEAINLDGNVYISANGTGIVEISPDVTITGNLTVEGNTIVNSQTVSITDAVINIGTAPNLGPLTVDDGYDRGIQFHYYDTQDRHSFFGQKHNRKYYILDDASSAGGVYSGLAGTLVIGTLETDDIESTGVSDLGNIRIYDNNIDTTNTNGDITVAPNGTGALYVEANSAFQYVGVPNFPIVAGGTDGIVIPTGTEVQRPASGILQPGIVRLNSTSGDFEGYNGTDWLPLSQAATSNTFFSTIFTGDGSTVSFNIPGYPTTESTFVSIEGTLQRPTHAYSVTGNTLTLTEAPANGDKIEVRTFTALGETVTALATILYENLTTSLTVIDQWLLSSFRSAEYIIQIDNGAGEYQQSRINLVHNGTTVVISETNRIYTGASPLATISAYIALGQVRLRAQAAAGSSNMVTMTRILLPI